MISSLPGFLGFLEPILYQPLLNILVFFYYYIRDLGIAVILLTLPVKILLAPVIIKSITDRKKMAKIQPEIQKIKEKHKNDRQKQGMMMMELFRREKFNPLSGFLLIILQLPILLVLFFLFKDIAEGVNLYPLYYNFTPVPQAISPYFFGLINLAAPNIILAVTAGMAQFLQVKGIFQSKKNEPKKEKAQFSPQEQITNIMTKHLVYFLPIMIVFASLMLPSVLALYFTFSSLFIAGLQYFYK